MLGSEEQREGPVLQLQWCHLLPAPPTPPSDPSLCAVRCDKSQSCHHPHGGQCCHIWEHQGDVPMGPWRSLSSEIPQVPGPHLPAPGPLGRQMQIVLGWLAFLYFSPVFLFSPRLSHLPSLSIFNQLTQPRFQCLRSGKVIPLHQQGTAHTSPLCAAPQPTQFCVSRVYPCQDTTIIYFCLDGGGVKGLRI